jgi:hypothetical protein
VNDVLRLYIVQLKKISNTSLTSLKEFKENKLVHVSLPLSTITQEFEIEFRNFNPLNTLKPRYKIVSSFTESVNYRTMCKTLGSGCDHEEKLVNIFLTMYANIRIFHSVKTFNAKLTKCKKLNF